MSKPIGPVSTKSLDRLKTYHWPGNVRELEKVVKRAIILADNGETVDVHHLPSEIVNSADGGRPAGGKRLGLKARIERVEREEIQMALKRNSGNKSRAAIDLGISYPSLLSKIKRYHL
jgi:transcriptional regulator with PAS, ATPase and Fis domain